MPIGVLSSYYLIPNCVKNIKLGENLLRFRVFP